MTATEPDFLDRLRASRAGDAEAQAVIYDMIHRELSAIAAYLLRREYGRISMLTGDLVNEAVLRLLQSPVSSADDKAHFLSIAARVMRQVLVDAARRRGAEKRRKITVTYSASAEVAQDNAVELQALETALLRLRVIDPERADIVIMRYYGGLSTDEIASAMGVSESTIRRSWRATRAWLKGAIEDDQQQ
ncbi:ECF-type sigma factor [Parvularcula sp. LCG005]|uniref:ECF-type sigma factor n=1 Tax=Parvularcula sp. LCG005 TaxID=3078805 RepID=UPI0029432346|nr:ECF-type sigma factor [Parvularcula sp. LCG005]WOI54422.1 ECF-type sigma factor [Parvularcula sp. LCG005]